MSTKRRLRPEEWRKSEHSGNNGDCIEVRRNGSKMEIRDSKDRGGPRLAVSRNGFAELVELAKAQEDKA